MYVTRGNGLFPAILQRQLDIILLRSIRLFRASHNLTHIHKAWGSKDSVNTQTRERVQAIPLALLGQFRTYPIRRGPEDQAVPLKIILKIIDYYHIRTIHSNQPLSLPTRIF